VAVLFEVGRFAGTGGALPAVEEEDFQDDAARFLFPPIC
jgi:hypothetical protein